MTCPCLTPLKHIETTLIPTDSSCAKTCQLGKHQVPSATLRFMNGEHHLRLQICTDVARAGSLGGALSIGEREKQPVSNSSRGVAAKALIWSYCGFGKPSGLSVDCLQQHVESARALSSPTSILIIGKTSTQKDTGSMPEDYLI